MIFSLTGMIISCGFSKRPSFCNKKSQQLMLAAIFSFTDLWVNWWDDPIYLTQRWIEDQLNDFYNVVIFVLLYFTRYCRDGLLNYIVFISCPVGLRPNLLSLLLKYPFPIIISVRHRWRYEVFELKKAFCYYAIVYTCCLIIILFLCLRLF